MWTEVCCYLTMQASALLFAVCNLQIYLSGMPPCFRASPTCSIRDICPCLRFPPFNICKLQRFVQFWKLQGISRPPPHQRLWIRCNLQCFLSRFSTLHMQAALRQPFCGFPAAESRNSYAVLLSEIGMCILRIYLPILSDTDSDDFHNAFSVFESASDCRCTLHNLFPLHWMW